MLHPLLRGAQDLTRIDAFKHPPTTHAHVQMSRVTWVHLDRVQLRPIGSLILVPTCPKVQVGMIVQALDWTSRCDPHLGNGIGPGDWCPRTNRGVRPSDRGPTKTCD